ncbi:MAG: peptide deformylase [Gammaproteobacteria bacterium RIFCSPHIGHO2_12_FULL_38_14]|nr:MAG: peptide deformylase [Gammaproteobacteria bacterium RIFCSPHIGHO2_12_FULL_38_14]
MAILDILQLPDPRLRMMAKPVERIDDEIRKIVDDMYETMYDARGVGLAATQVGIHKRIFVMDVSPNADQKYCVINPEIISQSGVREEKEGCLSVTGAYDTVNRAAKVRFRGMDLEGKIFEMDAEELMAACVQHEIDHLNGKLFIDHLSRLKQERIRSKLKKLNRK